MKKTVLLVACILCCATVLFGEDTATSGETTSTDSTTSTSGSTTSTSSTTGTLSENSQVAMSSPDYLVTPGDNYKLAFSAGNSMISYSIAVDTSYRIRIANLGVINCAGLTYLQLKQQVESLVLKNYPMGGVQFILLTPATFKVIVAGEVKETQEKKVWALTRLSSLIKDILTPFSSSRTITIESVSGKKKTYDLFRAERYGEMSNDPYVRPGDRIIVGRIDRKVTISGDVERPGQYELLPGENLKELVEIYGNGLKLTADTSRIQLYRLSGEANSGKISYTDVNAITHDMPLLCYDEVTINSYEDLKSAMFVEGAITGSTVSTTLTGSNRRTVTFIRGENYASLIRDIKNWFSASSDTSKAYIIRSTPVGIDENGKMQYRIDKIPLNLDSMLYDSSYYSTEYVQPNDTLLIPFRQFFVSVAGAVKSPGRFPYIPDRTWKYYVGLAGGIDTYQNMFEVMDIRSIDQTKLSKKDFIPPEATITVQQNSGWYIWNSQYAAGISTILSIISTFITVYLTYSTLVKS
jgi:polysaccharide biosynthesis/export protein